MAANAVSSDTRAAAASTPFVSRVLSSARDYLGANVSFLAEVAGDSKIVRATAGPAEAAGLPVGRVFAAEDSYCYRVLSGEIPEVIYDAQHDARARMIPLTSVLGIQSYMGVPVRLADGRPYGTLCCVNFRPDVEQRERDLGLMHFLADLVGMHLSEGVEAEESRSRRRAAVEAALAGDWPAIALEPVVVLATGEVVGMEALARFEAGGSPEKRFAEAWAVGLGPELELAAIEHAFALLPDLPQPLFLSVNASPLTVADPRFRALLAGLPGHRIVVEITEHAAIEDYAPLVEAAGHLRAAGIRIAIDDVGAGHSSLRHVLRIAPQMAKLDMSLTRGIDADPVRQALAVGMMAFSERTGVLLVAEGVETGAEADALQAIGVPLVQGYRYPGLPPGKGGDASHSRARPQA